MNAQEARIVASALKSAAKTAHKRAKALAAAERLERELESKLNVVAEYNGKTSETLNTVEVWATN
jgi:broad specificity phosphatase PhoE